MLVSSSIAVHCHSQCLHAYLSYIIPFHYDIIARRAIIPSSIKKMMSIRAEETDSLTQLFSPKVTYIFFANNMAHVTQTHNTLVQPVSLSSSLVVPHDEGFYIIHTSRYYSKSLRKYSCSVWCDICTPNPLTFTAMRSIKNALDQFNFPTIFMLSLPL